VKSSFAKTWSGRIAFVFGGQAAAMAIGFAKLTVLSRALGPEEFGCLGMLAAFVGTLQAFLLLRFEEAATRFISAAAVQEDSATIRNIVGAGLKYGLLMNFAVQALGSALAAWIPVGVPAADAWWLIWMIGATGPAGIVSAYWSALLKQRRGFSRLVTVATVGLALSLVAVAILAAVGRLGLRAAVAVDFAVLAGLSIYKWMVMASVLRERFGMRALDLIRDARWADLGRVEGLRRYLRYDFVSSSLSALVRQADVLFVGAFVSVESAGLYKLAKSQSAVVQAVGQAFETVIFPDLAERVAVGGRNLFGRLAALTRGWVVVVLAGTALAWGLSPWAIGWIYGAAYLGSVQLFRAILLGVAVSLSLFWTRPLALAMNRPEIGLWSSSAATVLYFGIAYFGHGRYGATAFAAGLGAAWAVGYLVNLVCVQRSCHELGTRTAGGTP
jgi:O-antigen/teichoic acid export membrane protein